MYNNKLHLENRLNKLLGNNKDNEKVINKLRRQIRNIEKVEK